MENKLLAKTEEFQQNAKNGAWVKNTDVVRRADSLVETQESISETKKQRMSTLALVGGIMLLLIGK